MSEMQEEPNVSKMKTLFEDRRLTGYEIAINDELSSIVRRDSTDFAAELINHERGRHIVCELIDVALRPRLLISYLEKKNKQTNQKEQSFQQNGEGSVLKSQLNEGSKEITTIVYNAIEILTNQYEQFVGFVFDQSKKDLIQSGFQGTASINMMIEENKKQPNKKLNQIYADNDDFEDTNFKSDKMQTLNGKQQKNKVTFSQQSSEEENWEDCVIMDSSFPQLTRNEEDEILQKMISMTKIGPYETYKCAVLDRMFLLFSQPTPIEETPVSYFNKIMLQFVYQRPEEIMRYFYCSEKSKKKQGEVKSCPKIRTIARHLYNSSVIELLVHLMELECEGNFFLPQKAQILKAIVEQVFCAPSVERNGDKQIQHKQQQLETSTLADLTEDRIANYILFVKQLYEKLQDRYEQEKFLGVFKSHVNDVKLLKSVIRYFQEQHHYFDANGLVLLLTQVLKFDQTNFRLHKSQQQSSNPFGGCDNFSFHNSSRKEEDSSIASYDLRLSTEVLDEIQKIILLLIARYKEQEGSTMRMIQYYQLIYCWLNVTIKTRQEFVRYHVITPGFINDCLFKFQEHQRSTILHNAIKNILADFLPKLNDAIKVVLDPECELIAFIQNYLTQSQNKKKKKPKCFENQLFHIGKAVLSVWEQHKMLSVIRKTSDDEEDCLQKMPLSQPHSPTTDSESLIRFQKLKQIITGKQQFYNHLICGNPRQMGEYQQQQSSEIIMASTFNNFFKQSLNSNDNSQPNGKTLQKNSKDRYAENDEQNGEKQKPKKKLQIQDLKRETNLKLDPKFRSLRIGEDNGMSLFQSAISPLNANRSHTFNFQLDALPLDSDKSEEAMSDEEDFPLRKDSGKVNEDEFKLMQQNIENFDMAGGNFLVGVESNILSQNNSISQERNFLSCDNYRRQQLSKSVDIPDMDNIQKVESYLAIESPRRQSEDDIMSLGMDSKNSGSKISEEYGSKVVSEILPTFMKEEAKEGSIIKMESETQQLTDSQFVRHYSSYLSYDVDDLVMDVE